MIRIFLTLALIIIHSSLSGQTFSGNGGAIPDNGNSVDFTLNVSGLPAIIDTTSFGVESVCINVLHTWNSDLDILIISPDSTTVILVSGVGGGSDNFIMTCFTGDAATSILQGNAPYSGIYRPLGQLGRLNNGQDPNGDWTLHILDTYPFADSGILLGWSITFGNDPATVFSLESSNLPIVKINTFGQTITTSPKITAWMGITDNGPGIRNYMTDSSNNYDGFIGIDIRGHSSQMFPQKQYGVETRDSLGNNLNAPILGMPAENDWVLYAPYNDKSLMRNVLTYGLANAMGRYASRSRYCELVLDGEYRGVYTFFEKIKRDNNRVNIAGLTLQDTTGTELTGGYICSLDWVDNGGWFSNFPPDQTNPGNNDVFYQYIYPKDVDILPQQENYIQQYVDSFETALASNYYTDPDSGWRKFGDEASFIDFFIVNELSKNVDGYRLSTYFYKDKITSGGKLNMGPVWDFNLAWHNADYCNNQFTTGWAYLFTDYCQWDFPFWWRRLMDDSLFTDNIRCRWEDLRTNVLDTTFIFGYIDSVAFLLDESQQRHYYIYPILGIWIWPNPNPLAQTYQDEILNMKQWIRQRLNFMDNNLPGNCIISSIQNPEGIASLKLFPNPAHDQLTVSGENLKNGKLTILNIPGEKLIEKENITDDSLVLDISHMPGGIYFVKLVSKNGMISVSRFVKM
jgi:subtilisin-like proprotein convertase family protein